MKVMHVVSTPRGNRSNTLGVSRAFLDRLAERVDQLDVDTLDLFQDALPAAAGDTVEAKYTLMLGNPIDPAHVEAWAQIENLITRFKQADVYVVSAPMWNLSIPYALKYFIDCVVQPGYTFAYNETGQAVPLVNGKSMVCVTSRGGDYGPDSPMNSYDFQEPYLRAIFGFIGITDIHFIHAQPMDVNVDLREAALASAIAHAHEIAHAAV